MPDEIKSVEWLSLGCNVFNAVVPFYSNVNDTPAYLKNTTGEPTTDDFYWTNRIVAALADAHYADTSSHIERYQQKAGSVTARILTETDEAFLEKKPADVQEFLEKANQKIADKLKVETDDLLAKVLYTASCKMKNGFARSDA